MSATCVGLTNSGTRIRKDRAISGTADELRGKVDDAADSAKDATEHHEGFLDKMKDKVDDAVDKVKPA